MPSSQSSPSKRWLTRASPSEKSWQVAIAAPNTGFRCRSRISSRPKASAPRLAHACWQITSPTTMLPSSSDCGRREQLWSARRTCWSSPTLRCTPITVRRRIPGIRHRHPPVRAAARPWRWLLEWGTARLAPTPASRSGCGRLLPGESLTSHHQPTFAANVSRSSLGVIKIRGMW